VEQAPEKQTVGCLVRPKPPVRRYADVVRELVQSMAASGFGGNKRIAQTLARAGFKIAKDTIRRIRKEKPPREPQNAQLSRRALRAEYPRHVFMVDLTDIPGLFRILSFTVAVVFDVFSRMPLAAKVFLAPFGSSAIASLFRQVARNQGAPRHSVSDQGTQFTTFQSKEASESRTGVVRFTSVPPPTCPCAVTESLGRRSDCDCPGSD
jgi:hypothetical protein